MSPIQESIELIEKLTKYEGKTPVEKTLKLAEETGELAQAVLSWAKVFGCAHKGKTLEDIEEEIADVLMVALSLGIMVGISPTNVFTRIVEKCAKWENVINRIRKDEGQDPC